MFVGSSAALMPCSEPAKYGSVSTRSSGSATHPTARPEPWSPDAPTPSPLWYPSRAIAASTAVWADGLTFRPPLMAREAVDLETPACLATSSRVGAYGTYAPTLEEVAKQAGVSRSTASRAING